MTKELLRDWTKEAIYFPEMRWPKYNLSIGSFRGRYNDNSVVIIKISTFVKNKDNTLMCLVRDQYEFSGQYEPNMLELSLDRFTTICELTEEDYIFDNNTSIEDPFNR